MSTEGNDKIMKIGDETPLMGLGSVLAVGAGDDVSLGSTFEDAYRIDIGRRSMSLMVSAIDRQRLACYAYINYINLKLMNNSVSGRVWDLN